MTEYAQNAEALLPRVQSVAGTLVVALSATPWISREFGIVDTDGRSLTYREDASLWGIFGTVNDKFVGAFALGVIVLMAFALVAILTSGRSIAVLVLALLAAVTTIIVIAVSDSGFSGTYGAWITLGVTAGTAAVAIVDFARGIRPASW